MELIVISTFISAGMVAVVSVFGPTRTSLVCVLLFASALLFAMCMSMALSLQSLITLLFFGLCSWRNARPITYLSCSIAAAILAYGFVLSMSWSELSERIALRKEYPVESISKRLEYEITEDDIAAGSDAPIFLKVRTAERLQDFEEQLDEREFAARKRNFRLQSLHRRTSDAFILAQGFGPVRMMKVRREEIELPETKPVSPPLGPGLPYEPESGRPVDLSKAQAPPAADLGALHAAGRLDFVDPAREGHFDGRDHVVGFLSHRFSELPEFPEDSDSKAQWQVVRLELIGLLSHDEPVAYVSQNLPQMDELREAETRPLDEFERRAVEMLQTEEDLHVGEGLNRIRMVGSLRAAEGCLKCHSVERGELLGAFSYELIRAEPIKPEPAAPAVIQREA